MPNNTAPLPAPPHANQRLLALDWGTIRIGVAVSDESQLAVSPLPSIERTSWKKTLSTIRELTERFDAAAVIIGLPLNLDDTETLLTAEVRRVARNLELSLRLPIFLQDERLTSVAAEAYLRQLKLNSREIKQHIDGHAAAIILEDFISSNRTQKHYTNLDWID